jgi:hypothetical protein
VTHLIFLKFIFPFYYRFNRLLQWHKLDDAEAFAHRFNLDVELVHEERVKHCMGLLQPWSLRCDTSEDIHFNNLLCLLNCAMDGTRTTDCKPFRIAFGNATYLNPFYSLPPPSLTRPELSCKQATSLGWLRLKKQHFKILSGLVFLNCVRLVLRAWSAESWLQRLCFGFFLGSREGKRDRYSVVLREVSISGILCVVATCGYLYISLFSN